MRQNEEFGESGKGAASRPAGRYDRDGQYYRCFTLIALTGKLSTSYNLTFSKTNADVKGGQP